MIEIDFQSRSGQLDRVMARVETFLEEWGADVETNHVVQMTVEELVTNIDKASPVEKAGQVVVRITLEARDNLLTMQITDNGRPFDPLEEAPAPDLEKPLEDRPIGGLGVHLVRTCSESVEYRRDGEHNIVTVRFRKEPSTLKEQAS